MNAQKLLDIVLFAMETLIILATAIYVYLCQEQNKLSPSDKYSSKYPNSIIISLGFGVISCLALFITLDKNSSFSNFSHLLAPCIGSVAALCGVSIGAFGAYRARNKSPLLRYGGLLLSVVGFINIPTAVAFIVGILFLSMLGPNM